MVSSSEDASIPDVHGQAVDEFGKIEVFGIDIIPDSNRHGTPKELFWPWFSANSTFINMITGGVLILLGLNIWEGLTIVAAGNLVFLLVGVCSLHGPKAGTATLTISRAPFGLRGNVVPAIFSWFATLGIGDDGGRGDLAAGAGGRRDRDNWHGVVLQRAEVLPVAGVPAVGEEYGDALGGVDR